MPITGFTVCKTKTNNDALKVVADFDDHCGLSLPPTGVRRIFEREGPESLRTMKTKTKRSRKLGED